MWVGGRGNGRRVGSPRVLALALVITHLCPRGRGQEVFVRLAG